MNQLRRFFIIVFAVLILLPVLFFNLERNAVSLIDNRHLAGNPFKASGDLTNNIDSFVNDRIGFRDKLISTYTILNDRLFGKMVHPSYSYGKDGFVFGAGVSTYNNFGEFHVVFANMIKSIQDYCEARDVPFLFVFNPAKPAVYQDKIAEGINYNREWVEMFFAELDERGVHYLDNTETLQALRAQGIDGFNQKYDANHWNDTGAFYGTQKILERMQELCPTVHVNELSEFSKYETLQTSLHVSDFPINEYVPGYSFVNTSFENMTSEYSNEISMHPSHRGFGYFVNESRKQQGTPKALVFQGSYMNGQGYKYFINAFGEYIYVHDYQNVIEFPYFFNIFQPECVIVEAGEYTLSDNYFSFEKMKAINYNPPLDSIQEDSLIEIDLSDQNVIVEEGETLVKILWETDARYSNVWMKMEYSYDMFETENGYQVTIDKEQFSATENMKLFVLK